MGEQCSKKYLCLREKVVMHSRWKWKTAIRLIFIICLMAGMLVILNGTHAMAQNGDAPPCRVVGAQLLSYEYSPMTGVAQATYSHSVAGDVYAEGFGRADLQMTQNQAERKARYEVLQKICDQVTQRVRAKVASERK